jgi:PleD family two-component response regulator
VQGIVPDDPRKAPKLRVLIVDDDARVRWALRSLIEGSPDLTVVGEAGDGGRCARLPGESTAGTWTNCST